ncbi:MAG: hypothetical protein WB421_09815 [Terriglobales bacterium]
MPEKARIEQIVAKTVSQVLDSHIPRLKEELVQQVLQELQPALEKAQSGKGDPSSSSGANPAHLLKAISSIHAGTTQKEILRSLLDSTVLYCGRAALFVIKAGTATGWQGRAFSNSDDIKDFPLDVSSGVAATVMQSRKPSQGNSGEFDTKFVSRFGAPADNQILLLPLLLKDKLAALVYADAGTQAGASMDIAALELLVVATSAWLEVASLRKQAQKEGPAEAGASEKSEALPVQSVSSFSDPFASHAPMHAPAAPAPVVEQAMAAAATTDNESAPLPVAHRSSAAEPPLQASQEDAEIHRKAQRFARLLLDEIKLYNQVKVTEGRKHKDLYDRLKEDIDKSRMTYQKRYGNTAAAGGDYLNQELLRSLAEDDISLMGPNFRR